MLKSTASLEECIGPDTARQVVCLSLYQWDCRAIHAVCIFAVDESLGDGTLCGRVRRRSMVKTRLTETGIEGRSIADGRELVL